MDDRGKQNWYPTSKIDFFTDLTRQGISTGTSPAATDLVVTGSDVGSEVP
ncbi:hypothetical protein [Nocardia neocaledoniensis]|nr:hypothetical protein [Nocardia neocaledoniensis]